jgi:hypothetical protein
MNYIADLYSIHGDYEERVAICAHSSIDARELAYNKMNCEAAIVDVVDDAELKNIPFKILMAE